MTRPEPMEPNFLKDHSSAAAVTKPRKKKRWLWFFVVMIALFAAMKFLIIPGIRIEGTVKAVKESEIKTATDGFLAEIKVENAQKAGKGEVLFNFENDAIRNALLEALQKKKNSEEDLRESMKVAEYSRKVMESARILMENGVIGRLESQKAELEHFSHENLLKEKRREQRELSAQIKTLHKEKEKLKIVAPYDGFFLGELNARKRTFFKKGELLGSYYDPHQFYMEVFVAEKDAKNLKVGDKTQTTFKALPGLYPGKITQIDAKVQGKIEKVFKIKYVVRVLILLEAFPEGLKPGMRGQTRVVLGMSQ